MSKGRHTNGIETPGPGLPGSPVVAKARLLAWAEESDARKLEPGWATDAIAAGAALALLGGMAITRALPRWSTSRSAPAATVRERAVSWALAARAAQWLLPHAVRAMECGLSRRARH